MSTPSTKTRQQQVVAECRSAMLNMLDSFVVNQGFRMAESRDALRLAATECFDELASLRSRRGFEQAHGLTASRISLVSEDDLLFTLELTSLARRLREHCAFQLSRLHPRFMTLLDQEDAAAEQLPVGPEAISRALRGLTENAGLDPEQRIALLEKWTTPLCAELLVFYKSLEEHLDQAGIRARPPAYKVWNASGNASPEEAPDEAPAQSTRPVTPRSADAWPVINAEPAPPAATPTSTSTPASTSTSTTPAWPAIFDQPVAPHARLHQKLMQAHRQPTTGALDPQLAASMVEQVRTWLTGLQNSPTADIPSVSASPLVHLLAPSICAGIETLERMFEYITAHPDLPAPIKHTLRILQIPLVKLALDDPDVAQDPEHPALKLLDTIALVGNTLPLHNPDHPGYARLAALARQLAELPRLQLNHLEATLPALLRYAEGRRNTAANGIEQALPLAARAERREIARAFASRALGALIDDATPPALRRFLTIYWIQVLVRTLYKEGEKHPDWRGQLEIAHQLLLTGDPATARRQPPEALARHHAELINRIAIRLTSIGLGTQAQNTALAECRALHAALLAGKAPDAGAPAADKVPPMTISAAREMPHLRLLHHTGYTELQTNAPRWMTPDTWLEISLSGQTPVHGCIVWMGPAAKVALLSSPDTGGLLAVTANCLADLRARGQCRVGSNVSLTERAVQATLKSMQA
ncbi:MAG: DUF1631 family protein [Rhodocyclales bacterium]|nr:DUF1631 family protein [Rhodocyclales bacterium]